MSRERRESRYRVVATRSLLEEAEIYVTAASEARAVEIAEASVDSGLGTEFEATDSEYCFAASPVGPGHDVLPTNPGAASDPVCLACEGPVLWTGIDAQNPRNTTGKTVPGPWIHVPNVLGDRDESHRPRQGMQSTLVHSTTEALMDLWVLMITEGTVLAFPPEIYETDNHAMREAARWRQTVSKPGHGLPDPDDGPPWDVGDFMVRLIKLSVAPVDFDDSWVASYWTTDGYPDPEAVLLADRAAALEWVMEPPAGFGPPIETFQSELFVASTYLDRGEEAYAVAHVAKRIRTSSRDAACAPPPEQVRYEIEVAVSRLQRVEASLFGFSGLTREGVEDLVEGNWNSLVDLVVDDHVISWNVESFVETTRLGHPPAG